MFLRVELFSDVTIFYHEFVLLSANEKSNTLLTRNNIAKIVGQFIINAFNQRLLKNLNHLIIFNISNKYDS